MNNQFYKGRTNQHLSWAMVDATDFATPESALSAAMKIKIWGKLRGATVVNFVSSGTGSLTNDIQHVGPSVLGIYTIALAKADLSDASAAWYDQYIVNLSATGAAYQTLIVDGGIDLSALSALQSRISDMQSFLVAMSSLESDIYSQLSDFRSDIHSFVSTTGVGLHASALSDIRSAIAAGPAATVTASDISDIASAVRAALVSDLSDILSAVVQANSRALVIVSSVSDVYSLASDLNSDFRSLITTTGVQLNASTLSDIRSAIAAGPAATVTASDISDIASAVRAALVSDLSDILSAAVQTNSRVLLNQSRISDIASFLVVMSGIQSDMYSQLSDFRSDIHSFMSTTGVGLHPSAMSDLRSAIAAITATLSASDLSDIRSAITASTSDLRSFISTTGPTVSDLASAVNVELGSRLSDILSAAVQTNSRVLLNQSRISDIASYLVAMSSLESDIYSQLSDFRSDLHSFVSTTGVGLHASALSDVRSAIAAGPAATVTASDISDIASAVWAHVVGTRVDSRVLVAQSFLSDIRSQITAGVPIQLSDMSDLRSAIAAVTATLSASDISDIASAVWGTASNSAMSDLRSAILAAPAGTLTQSDISDIASAVVAALPITSLVSDAHSAAAQANSRILVVQSMVSDIRSQVSDLQSDFQSRVPKLVATNSQVSDLASDLRSHAAANLSVASDVQSMLSDLLSDFQSRVPKRVATDSQLSDVLSDLRSQIPALVWNEASAGHGGAGTTGKLLIDAKDAATNGYQASAGVSQGPYVLGSTGNDTTHVHLPAFTHADDQLNNYLLTIFDVSTGEYHSRYIDDWVQSTQLATLDRALPFTPASATDQYFLEMKPLPDKLMAHQKAVLKAVVGSGSTTVSVKLSTVDGVAPSAVNDFYNGRVLIFTSGALAGQATSISAYVGGTTIATVIALTGAPANGVTAVIV